MSDVGKVEGPFGFGAAPVPPKGVGIMVGTDLAGGNERCSLVVVVEGTVTVVSAMVTVISGTVTVNVGFDSVERREPPDSDGTVDGRDGITVEDSRNMLDDGERELIEDVDGNEVMLELDWSPTGTTPLVLDVLVEVPLVVVRVIVMQMVVVVLQAVTVVVQGVKETLSGGAPLTTSFSC